MRWRKKGEGKGGNYFEKENVFFCGGEEKEENIWRRKVYFLRRRRKGEGKGGKYTFAEEKKIGEGQGGNYLEKENIFLRSKRRTEREKEENMMKKETLIVAGGWTNGWT